MAQVKDTFGRIRSNGPIKGPHPWGIPTDVLAGAFAAQSMGSAFFAVPTADKAPHAARTSLDRGIARDAWNSAVNSAWRQLEVNARFAR